MVSRSSLFPVVVRSLIIVAVLFFPGFDISYCLCAKDDKKTDSKVEKVEQADPASKSVQKTKESDRNYGPMPDGRGRTKLFGIEGVGYKFVYVIDRSGSMGGDGNAALKAAKAELTASIKKLERTNAFQIVFYNDRVSKFNPGGKGMAVFATDRNKELAEKFLDSISAQGGTEHEAALFVAFKMKPDVVFWLTDADRPRLDDEQIARVNNLASGVIVHTIEFGTGPQKEKDKENFLKILAEANAGEHIYIDVAKLKKEESKAKDEK